LKGAVGIYFDDDVFFYRRGRIGRNHPKRGGGRLLRVVVMMMMMMREWARDEVIRWMVPVVMEEIDLNERLTELCLLCCWG